MRAAVGRRKRKGKEQPPPVERYGDRLVARNKRVAYDYQLGARFEAGLVLYGSEVKMLREHTADLTDAFCKVERGEAWLYGLNIPALQGSPWSHVAKRGRKLLLHRHQIAELSRAIDRQGMTAVAVRLYFRGGRAKVELALARGKRKADKRQTLKARQAERDARAAAAERRGR